MRLAWQPRFHNPDLAKWLHRDYRPVSIVWGASDRIVPLAFGHAFHVAIPDSTLTVIPGTGHAPHIEEPAAFVAELRRFIGT